MRQDCLINLRHYRSIYTTSMGFSPHRTEIRQFKISPTVFSEQTANIMFANISAYTVCGVALVNFYNPINIVRHNLPICTV